MVIEWSDLGIDLDLAEHTHLGYGFDIEREGEGLPDVANIGVEEEEEDAMVLTMLPIRMQI